MTEVWWCAVHFSGYAIDPENHAEEGRICYKAALLDSHGCIGVPRRLVPVDALVIVREDGNWPAKVQSKAAEAINDYAWSTMAYVDVDEDALAVLILDALAEAAKESPQ